MEPCNKGEVVEYADISLNTSLSTIKALIGDEIVFKTNYMAVARLLNSKFIDKNFV